MINKFSSLLLHPVFLLLIIGVLISTSVYSYIQFQSAQDKLTQYQVELDELKKFRDDPNAAASVVRILVDQIGRLVALPTDETPTIATITDVEKLREQPFFANAENEDKILIYTQAKKAYLYRPSENKIIEIAPVNVTPRDETEEQSSEEGTNTDESDSESTNSPTVTIAPTSSPIPTEAPSSPEATSSGDTE